MCSQYTLKTDLSKMSDLGIEVPASVNAFAERFLPKSVAPVVVKDKSSLKLTPMAFSLVPSWSSEPKVKFATHNARIESIIEKPTWKKPFRSQHCLIPMTGFFESVYEGPEAGNIILFTKPSKDLLFAAGIFDYWEDKIEKEKSFFSFSILTREPSDFILHHGHDRTPIFLKNENAFEWLDLLKKDDEFMREELLRQAYHPELNVTIDRPLKAGWEKRK